MGRASGRPAGREARSRFQEVLRQHLHVRQHGHEVGVPRPARDDVQVDMVDHAGAGDAAEVPAQVVAVRAVLAKRQPELVEQGSCFRVALHD